jgi:hypothetical protein
VNNLKFDHHAEVACLTIIAMTAACKATNAWQLRVLAWPGFLGKLTHDAT